MIRVHQAVVADSIFKNCFCQNFTACKKHWALKTSHTLTPGDPLSLAGPPYTHRVCPFSVKHNKNQCIDFTSNIWWVFDSPLKARSDLFYKCKQIRTYWSTSILVHTWHPLFHRYRLIQPCCPCPCLLEQDGIALKVKKKNMKNKMIK